MKLTTEQIQQLYKFTRQHYVEHYDVQTELVDHLANDIEQIWEEQPHLSFEQARTVSFKKFGVFGFMDVVEARSKALNKKYWKLVWNIFKDFYKVPQIITTLMVFLIIFSGFIFITNQFWVLIFLAVLVIPTSIVRLIQLNKQKKRRLKQTGKKWLLEEYILNGGNFGSFSYIVFQFPIQLDFEIQSLVVISLLSLFYTSFLLICYIIMFILPSETEEVLTKQYPEYKLV